jgi:hypothetical protein
VFGPFVRWSWTVIKSLVRLTALLYVAYGATEMFGLGAGLLSASAMYYFLRIPPAPLLADRLRKAKLLEEMQSVYQILGHSPVCPALVRDPPPNPSARQNALCRPPNGQSTRPGAISKRESQTAR